MTQALHSQARTTHLIRTEIRASTLSQAALARLYNVTRQTIRKWQDRESPADGSHCPNTMYTTLTPAQELIVVELRRTLLLPTDDLLALTREFINRAVSRAGLGRRLRRHGVSSLNIWSPGKKAVHLRQKRRSRITGLAFYIQTSSTYRRCRTKQRGVICSSRLTAQPAGSTWTSMPTRQRAAVSTFCPR